MDLLGILTAVYILAGDEPTVEVVQELAMPIALCEEALTRAKARAPELIFAGKPVMSRQYTCMLTTLDTQKAMLQID